MLTPLRHRNHYSGSLSQFAVEAKPPLMFLTHHFYIKKSQTEPFHIVYISGRDAEKLVKNPLLILFGNTDAVVLNGKYQRIVFVVQPDANFGFVNGIFYAIVDEVMQDIGQV